MNGFGRDMHRHEGFDFGKGFAGFEKMFGGGRDRMFKKGNLQFMVLRSLESEPKHGYQVIKDLEEQFKGFYTPSPGSVYPILQMLEDRDFVSVTKEGNKKIYTITEEGKTFLEENEDQDEFAQRMKQFKNMNMKEMNDIRHDIQSLFKDIMMLGRDAMQDEEKKEAFKAFLKQAQVDVRRLNKGDQSNDDSNNK